MATLQEVENENVARQIEMLTSLYGIWNSVGFDSDDQVNRANNVWGYVFDLLKEIHAKETGFYEDVKECIKNYETEISELTAELGLPVREELGASSLIVRKEVLRQQLDELSELKHERIKLLQELRLQEMKYCNVLGMLPTELSSSTVAPKEKDIYELEQHLQMLKVEKTHRQKKFRLLKKELTTILEITELTPETPLEKEILSSKEESSSLSNETFKALQEFVVKTKGKKVDLENEMAFLMHTLFIWWDILEVGKRDRETFLSEHTGCRVSNLNAIKEEIARCEKIKQHNIEKYIELKKELSCLWKKCFISECPKMSLVLQHEEEDVNETVLEAYFNEVAKWRKYYKDTEHIIKKIEKREKLWNLMIVLENKAKDPNRFKNRGGNLLQEERDRKKFQKDLPALENEIFLDIEKFEEETRKPFLYYGEDFRVFVAKQWQDQIAQKRNEKNTRQKLRSKQTEDSSIRRTTPLKRTLISATPKSAPSKLFKTTVGVSIYRTPNLVVAKPVPCTTAKMRTTRQVVKQQSNSVKKTGNNTLNEKNENIGRVSGLDSTTYSDLAEKLERSSRNANRSSVLCSRKIAGTRISTSKRKSVSKSLQKFMKKKDSSKITPVRGKMGLPFLI